MGRMVCDYISHMMCHRRHTTRSSRAHQFRRLMLRNDGHSLKRNIGPFRSFLGAFVFFLFFPRLLRLTIFLIVSLSPPLALIFRCPESKSVFPYIFRISQAFSSFFALHHFADSRDRSCLLQFPLGLSGLTPIISTYLPYLPYPFLILFHSSDQ